jgi:hypothetical protein
MRAGNRQLLQRRLSAGMSTQGVGTRLSYKTVITNMDVNVFVATAETSGKS